MDFFNELLKWLINLSVIITAIVVYLNINKIWSRKHETVVAESVSVVGQLISLLTILPFLISYSFQGNYSDAIYQLFWFIYTAFLILTGIGFWVKEHKYLGIWQKFLKSLKQEKNEVGNLIKDLITSPEKQKLLTILHYLAWLDGELDERERLYIETFTHQLEIDFEFLWDHQSPEKGIDKFNYLCQAVQQYLANNPPKKQVKLLSDLVHTLIAVDEKITLEEEVSVEEIESMIHNYADEKVSSFYQIIIHPKNAEQEKAILSEIPAAKPKCILGDYALIAESFYTQRYAEMISESYREKGWFTVVYKNTQTSINITQSVVNRGERPLENLQIP